MRAIPLISQQCATRGQVTLVGRWPCVISLLWCLALLAFSSLSLAQSDAETEIARERFREGVSHYDNQQFDKARLAFLQAYALKPHPAVLLNLAQSELRAKRFAEAATNFDRYIRNNPSSAAMEHARAAMAECRQQVAEVNIGVNVQRATIMVDGTEVGTSPLTRPVFLTPGSHVVSARIAADSIEQVLQSNAGQQLYVTLELSPLGAAQEQLPARTEQLPRPQPDSGGQRQTRGDTGMSQRSGAEPPRASFFQWLGHSPEAFAGLTIGVFGLTSSAVLGGFASSQYASARNLKNDIETTLLIDRDNNVLVSDVTACGQAANGVGFNDGLSDFLRDRRQQQYAVACSQFSNRSDSGDRLKTLAIVGLGVGAAASIGTVLWYFIRESDTGQPERPDQSRFGETAKLRATIVPVLGPNTQGMSLSVRF